MRELNVIEQDIKRVLNKIRPYINADGGDLEYVSFADGIVHIRMLGACAGCGGIEFTLKDGIEALLLETIPEVIEVVNDGDIEL